MKHVDIRLGKAAEGFLNNRPNKFKAIRAAEPNRAVKGKNQHG